MCMYVGTHIFLFLVSLFLRLGAHTSPVAVRWRFCENAPGVSYNPFAKGTSDLARANNFYIVRSSSSTLSLSLGWRTI